ncbi:MAG: hypothetical protein KDC98_20600, partial [Planctomycetes bacterium]|nr:hypothetical protein [Planctomycetota bacterium]
MLSLHLVSSHTGFMQSPLSRALVLFLSLTAFVSHATAQKTWTGANGDSWNDPGNWSPAGVPTQTDDVTIPVTATQPRSYVAAPVCADLTVLTGASMQLQSFDLVVSGSVRLDGSIDLGVDRLLVAGDWDGGGVATGSGGVTFTATGLTRSIPGGLPDVTVSGGIRTFGDTDVTGALALTGGTLTIDGRRTLQVQGNATFTGGTISWVNDPGYAQTLDVNGNLSITGTVAGAIFDGSVIRVA